MGGFRLAPLSKHREGHFTAPLQQRHHTHCLVLDVADCLAMLSRRTLWPRPLWTSSGLVLGQTPRRQSPPRGVKRPAKVDFRDSSNRFRTVRGMQAAGRPRPSNSPTCWDSPPRGSTKSCRTELRGPQSLTARRCRPPSPSPQFGLAIHDRDVVCVLGSRGWWELRCFPRSKWYARAQPQHSNFLSQCPVPAPPTVQSFLRVRRP